MIGSVTVFFLIISVLLISEVLWEVQKGPRSLHLLGVPWVQQHGMQDACSFRSMVQSEPPLLEEEYKTCRLIFSYFQFLKKRRP